MTRRDELKRIIELKEQRLEQLHNEQRKVTKEIIEIGRMIAELDNASERKSAAV